MFKPSQPQRIDARVGISIGLVIASQALAQLATKQAPLTAVRRRIILGDLTRRLQRLQRARRRHVGVQ